MFDRGDYERRQRRLRDLLYGIPSVLVAGTLATLFSYVWSQERQLVDIYRHDAAIAFQDERFDDALICYQRVVRLEPSEEDRFFLARTAYRSGDVESAFRIMQQLAPDDQRGYGPAHVWHAQKCLESGQLPDEVIDTVITHLSFAMDTEHRNAEVSFLLSKCYRLKGEILKSMEALHEASQLDPSHWYDLFQLCQQIKELKPAADKAAENAGGYLRERIANDPLDHTARKRFIETQIWLNAFDVLQEFIDNNQDQDTGPVQWNMEVSSAYFTKYRQLKEEKADLGLLLDFIERSLNANPDSEIVLEELTNLELHDEAGRVEDLLADALTRGQQSGILHFMLGSRLWIAKKYDEVKFHFERSMTIEPRMKTPIINLAHLELGRDAPNTGEALRVLELVDEPSDQNAKYFATRGRLLVLSKRWREALDDLALVEGQFENDAGLHEALAQCYEHLQQPALAEQHRSAFERLRQKELEEQDPLR